MFAPESKVMEKQGKTVETPLGAIIICVSASGKELRSFKCALKAMQNLDPHQSQILSTMSKKTEGLNLVGWRGQVLKFRSRKSCNKVLKRVRD